MPLNPTKMRQALDLARRSIRAVVDDVASRFNLAAIGEYLGLLQPAAAFVRRDSPSGAIAGERRMLDGPVLQSLLGLALPIMGANMLLVANQFIDAFWVGRLGAVGVASVSVSTPIIIVMLTFGMGFGIAGTALVAQYAGARRRDMVDEVAGQTLITVLALSFVLAILGALAAPLLLDLMGVAPDVRAGALAFLHIGFLSLPFSFAYFMFQGLMRGVGHASITLKLTAGMVLLNFLLNPILIFGAGPIPAMGVAGSALSTLIAQFCVVVVALTLLSRGRQGVRVHWRKLRPDFDAIKRTFLLGYPAAIEGAARGLSLIVMTFLVAGFGTVATASYGVGNTILSLIVIPAMGFSMAASTLVGQNIGAGQIERAERVGRAACVISFVGLCICGLLCIAFAETLVRLFVPRDARVIHEAGDFVRIMSWSFGLMGLHYACTGVLRGAGLMTKTMLISLIAQWAVQFPLAYILAERTPLGTHGIYWAIFVASFVAAGMAFYMFARGDWKRARLIQPEPA